MKLRRFINKWWRASGLVFLILYFWHKIITERAKAIPDIVIIGIVIIVGKFYWNHFYKLNNKNRLKLLVNTQKICFPLVLIMFLFRMYIPDVIFTLVWMTGMGGIISSIMLKKYVKATHRRKDTLEQRIKSDLKIHSKTYRKRFVRPFGFIGGFVTPAFPFFSMLNRNWKKQLNKEALIHENVHLYYLQNGFIFILLLGSLVFITPVYLASNNAPLAEVALYIYMVCALVFFEFITFRKTHDYADKLNITTREWDFDICYKYFIVYSIQIFIIIILILSVRFGLRKLIEVIL